MVDVVSSVSLGRMARSIASNRGEKGSIIITMDDDGCLCIATNGLSPEEVDTAAVTLIQYNFKLGWGGD